MRVREKGWHATKESNLGHCLHVMYALLGELEIIPTATLLLVRKETNNKKIPLRNDALLVINFHLSGNEFHKKEEIT